MKITEETKIKDIIPKGMEVDTYTKSDEHVYIKLKSASKFEDYKRDFINTKYKNHIVYDHEIWDEYTRLNFLWFIVKKETPGEEIFILSELLKLIYIIYGDHDELLPSNFTDRTLRIYYLLPESFIKLFKS
jgi:hypothetical protein